MKNLYQEIEHCVTHDNNVTLREILRQNKSIELNNGDLFNLSPPLYRAATFGFNDICETLLSYGADVNYSKDKIFYPLEGASSSNKIETAGLLLRNGADINAYDLVRISAIGSACLEGHYEMVKFLIENGADINRINIGMYVTPLDLAQLYNHEKIIKILKDKGGLSNINHDFDWSVEDAGGISAHIDYYIGRVLPNRFNIQPDGTFYRIAVVNKNKNVLLFSTGNYKYSKTASEFLMVLPLGWNPYDEKSISSLPYKIMEWISKQLQEGYSFQNGDFISLDKICQSPAIEYDGFYIIDYDYNEQGAEHKADSSVTLFTLIPQKKKKNSQYDVTPEKLTKLRGSKWNSLEWKNIPTL